MIALRFRYRVTLWAEIEPHRIISYPATATPSLMGYYTKEHWTEPLVVPLRTFELWTLGRMEDRAQGIEIKVSNELVLQYHDSRRYPKQLFRIIRNLGPNAIEKLLKFGCIDPETYTIITERLLQLENGSADQAGKDGSDASKGSGAISADTPEMIAERAEALKLGDDEQWMLKEAYKHEGLVLTTTPWTKVLDYDSTSGPFNFFARNEKRGLLVITKDPSGEGTSIRFTGKGKRYLRYYEAL